MMRSNLRWCSDGLEFACWNGDVIRLAFLMEAHDREIISWRAVANTRINGSDGRILPRRLQPNREWTALCPGPG